MSKLSNTLTMLELLQTGKKYSIKELASILEVSERMIRIYKEDLDKSGIYIDTIMGPYGGYVLNQPIKLPIKKFNKSDYELLSKYIKSEKDEKLKNKLIILQEKIKGSYINTNTSKLNLTDETLKKYNVLTHAIKEKRKVKITYYSYGKGENERIIDPAWMFLFQDGWYCAAFCELKKDIRHFELKRIIKYELLDEIYD